MIKRPKPGDTEENILQMQEEFLEEQKKNPQKHPAAQVVRAPKKSLFAQKREKAENPVTDVQTPTEQSSSAEKELLEEIFTKIVGDVKEKKIPNIVMGDIVEKVYDSPKSVDPNSMAYTASLEFPPSGKESAPPEKGDILLSDGEKEHAPTVSGVTMNADKADSLAQTSFGCGSLEQAVGSRSVVVEDSRTAEEVHKENLQLLSNMTEGEILEEQRKLIESIEPSLLAFLAKKRQDLKPQSSVQSVESNPGDSLANLPENNPAVDLYCRGQIERWVHFDTIEKDKLDWMRDIPLQVANLKPGEKFEARFDLKGVLMPYGAESKPPSDGPIDHDYDRVLYMHGDEPHRPGYTLQELFRLARSNVTQQRVLAFAAIAGMLNIYNQGFYDQVLELPISKIFFLLRFALDDNGIAMLEVVARAMAYLFYNETDEILLDLICDNPLGCWQPILQVTSAEDDAIANSENDGGPSLNALMKQMRQLRVAGCPSPAPASAWSGIDETEEEENNKATMSDLQLAETDLIVCLMRSNILQRVYFILHSVRPDNSTVSSCLKLLIRIARSGNETALEIVDHSPLMETLFVEFLPGMEFVDTSVIIPPFYGYPQYLCLKLMRILISQSVVVATRVTRYGLIDKLSNYLFNRDDIRAKLIHVQIESLRILRCLILMDIDHGLYRKFLPAFRYMLDWHYNHVIYNVGGPHLLRQHASALLAVISSGSGMGLEAKRAFGDILHDCCCSWTYEASRHGINESSQAALLTACFSAVTWFTRQCDPDRFLIYSEKYLNDLLLTPGFERFVATVGSSSMVLRNTLADRRNVHPPLPNAGAILMDRYGPQLAITQTYPMHLLSALWRLIDQRLELDGPRNNRLTASVIRPAIIEPLAQYLSSLADGGLNRLLATNFFAKIEIKLICQLLFFGGFDEYVEKSKMLEIVYNFLCCLTSEYVSEIEQLLEQFIFNKTVMLDIDEVILNKWRNACMAFVYPHYVVLSPSQMRLALPAYQPPILPQDWPYFQLKLLLQNYIKNVQQKPTELFPEKEILRMTFSFVDLLEQHNPSLKIVSPTEKLMYLMIAFMGPDSEFLDEDIHQLLHKHLVRFYDQCSRKKHTFQFEAVFEDKCKFENLYALFVEHFQAVSYGDELFGSLVLVPLAQKYDNKWRRRMWSDYSAALSFLDCDESLLIGGLQSYLEPPETDESMIRAYNDALNTNQVRVDTIPYKIAKYHVDKWKETHGI